MLLSPQAGRRASRSRSLWFTERPLARCPPSCRSVSFRNSSFFLFAPQISFLSWRKSFKIRACLTNLIRTNFKHLHAHTCGCNCYDLTWLPPFMRTAVMTWLPFIWCIHVLALFVCIVLTKSYFMVSCRRRRRCCPTGGKLVGESADLVWLYYENTKFLIFVRYYNIYGAKSDYLVSWSLLPGSLHVL